MSFRGAWMSRLAAAPIVKGKGDEDWGLGLRRKFSKCVFRAPSGDRQASKVSKMNPAHPDLSAGGFLRGFYAIFMCFGVSVRPSGLHDTSEWGCPCHHVIMKILAHALTPTQAVFVRLSVRSSVRPALFISPVNFA